MNWTGYVSIQATEPAIFRSIVHSAIDQRGYLERDYAIGSFYQIEFDMPECKSIAEACALMEQVYHQLYGQMIQRTDWADLLVNIHKNTSYRRYTVRLQRKTDGWTSEYWSATGERPSEAIDHRVSGPAYTTRHIHNLYHEELWFVYGRQVPAFLDALNGFWQEYWDKHPEHAFVIAALHEHGLISPSPEIAENLRMMIDLCI